jgi:hypothetical protein
MVVTDDDEIAQQLEQKLTDGKFTSLPWDHLDAAAATVDVDGVTIALGGKEKAPIAIVSAGGKKLAQAKLPVGGARSVVIVRPSWVYVETHELKNDGIGPSQWTAIKVALPAKVDAAMTQFPSETIANADQRTVRGLFKTGGCMESGEYQAARASEGELWIGAVCKDARRAGVWVAIDAGVVGAEDSHADDTHLDTFAVYDAGFPLACATWHGQRGKHSIARLTCFVKHARKPVFDGDAGDGETYAFVVGDEPTIVETRDKQTIRHVWDAQSGTFQ